ncbi:hypothetical protein BKA69DRAFT_1178685 [Paraphysoderma sedebokerense]|nr:hypothetical protein BKA69DRAFT_1178685 [Paraphysoderma sedebokerense]
MAFRSLFRPSLFQMMRNSIILLFALAALQNGAVAIPAPPPISTSTEAVPSITSDMSTFTSTSVPGGISTPPVITDDSSVFTPSISPMTMPTETLSGLMNQISTLTTTSSLPGGTSTPPFPDENSSLSSGIGPMPTFNPEKLSSALNAISTMTTGLGSLPTELSNPSSTEGTVTGSAVLPESPATSLVNPASSTSSTAEPSSTQQGSPKSTSSFVQKAPVPTLISNNPLETQVNIIANFQKTLNTSLNEQGTKLTVQVSSSSSGQSFRGDFSLQTWNLTSSENVINFANLSSNFWSPITIADVPNNKNVAIKSISTTFSMRNPNSNGLLAPKDLSLALTEVMLGDSSSDGNVTVNFEAYMGVYFKKGDESEYSSAASSLSIGGGKGRFNWTNAITMDSVASTLSTDSAISVEDVPNANPPESVAYVAFKTNGKFNSLVWDPEVILEEEKLVQSFNQTDAKSGVEKLFSTGSSMVVMVVASIAVMLLNVF